MNWFKTIKTSEDSNPNSPFSKKLKLFGVDAERVTTQEANLVFEEMKNLLQGSFTNIEMTSAIASKQDHGDIDILIVDANHSNVINILKQKLGNQIKKISSNGNTKSVLFYSEYLHKNVHVDFIVSENSELQQTRKQYYYLNDFSFAIGIVAKNLHFKYGSDGFFKRFQDKKGSWKDILISRNLNEGLVIMGYDASQLYTVKDYDNMAVFISSSPLFDSSYFIGGMKADDRQAIKARSGAAYLSEKLKNLNKNKQIQDEDYFLKTIFPNIYIKIESEKQNINNFVIPPKTKYDGNWIMSTFGIGPGKQVGDILKKMQSNFGDQIDNAPEQKIINFVKGLIL